MKRILIGYVTQNFANGINQYLINFIKSLKNEQIEIDILTKDDLGSAKKILKECKIRNIYKISRNTKPIKQYNEMKSIIKENNYDIAYFNISNSDDCIGILAAKRCKVDKIISHSHSSNIDCTNIIIRIVKNILNTIFKPVVGRCCNQYLACSKKAAKWLYPNYVIENNLYQIIYNSVDDNKFRYNEDTRMKLRKKLNLENKFVIGHIGRFSYVKNHKFMLDILKQILKKRKDIVLVFVGDGKDFEKIKKYAKKIKVEDSVIFTGRVTNVNDYLQIFDVFILPSKFEGLPIVGIEAQFSGVPCLFSSTISDEVIIGKESKILNIKNSKIWIKEILKVDKRENKKNENAEKFSISNNEKQIKDIIDNKNKVNRVHKYSLEWMLKLLLSIHFIINMTSYINGFNLIMIPSAIITLLILVKNIKKYKIIINNKTYFTLGLFIFSYILTFGINTKYNIIGSIKVLIWLLLHFFFVNNFLHIESNYQLKKELKAILIIIISIVSIINIINIVYLINNITGIATSFDGEKNIVGITSWGRFYGIFYDPNYASVVCVATILMTLYLYHESEKNINKLLLIILNIIQLIYIYFCQSRSGLVTLAVGLVTYYICYFIINKQSYSCVKKIIIGLLILLLFTVIPKETLKLYNFVNNFKEIEKKENYITNIIKESEEKDTEKNDTDIKQNSIVNISEKNDADIKANINEKENEVKIENKKTIERKDNAGDISNRRFDIWNSGIQIFRDNPIIGVGFTNIKGIALDKYPNTYIVNNDFAIFTVFHNSIIDIMVSQGIIGILIVIFLFINILHNMLKCRKVLFKEENANETSLILSIIIAISVSSMFLSEIFYINNACTFIFWLMFGYLNYYIDRRKV